MKAEITEKGIELYVENNAEFWAIKALCPVGESAEDRLRKIIIHGGIFPNPLTPAPPTNTRGEE